MKRPFTLSVFSILSMTGGAAGFIISLILVIGGGLAGKLASLPLTDTIAADAAVTGSFFNLIKVLLFAASFTGAFLMWKMKKSGYWIYMTAQAVLLSLPFFFLQSLGMPYLLIKFAVNLVFTLLFILAYTAMYRKLS